MEQTNTIVMPVCSSYQPEPVSFYIIGVGTFHSLRFISRSRNTFRSPHSGLTGSIIPADPGPHIRFSTVSPKVVPIFLTQHSIIIRTSDKPKIVAVVCPPRPVFDTLKRHVGWCRNTLSTVVASWSRSRYIGATHPGPHSSGCIVHPHIIQIVFIGVGGIKSFSSPEPDIVFAIYPAQMYLPGSRPVGYCSHTKCPIDSFLITKFISSNKCPLHRSRIKLPQFVGMVPYSSSRINALSPEIPKYSMTISHRTICFHMSTRHISRSKNTFGSIDPCLVG